MTINQEKYLLLLLSLLEDLITREIMNEHIIIIIIEVMNSSPTDFAIQNAKPVA